MHDIAAPSLLRRAARAGRRFLAEVTISAVATLSVTLALSGWLRREDAAAPVVQPVSAAPLATAASPTSAEGPPTQGDAGLRLLRSVQPENGKPSLRGVLEPAPSGPSRRAELPRPRGHGAKPACAPACAAHALATVHDTAPSGLAAADPQLPPAPARPEAPQRPQYAEAGAPLPPLPIPTASVRPARSVLGPVAAMSDLLIGLAARW